MGPNIFNQPTLFLKLRIDLTGAALSSCMLAQYPREWTQVLLSLTPAAADRLLTYWDSVDDGQCTEASPELR